MYVSVEQNMYERSMTVVTCTVGQTEEFKVEVQLHQQSALGPFLFKLEDRRGQTGISLDNDACRWHCDL